MSQEGKTKQQVAIECAEELAPSYMKPLFEKEESVAPWVLLAMDEYAKQEAIVFADWATKNGYYQKESKDGWYWYNGPSSFRHTTDKLYTLYKSSNK